jgi:hypothetical protein
MPSLMHEMLLQMFRDRPELVTELLSDLLGVPVPPFERAHLSSAEVNSLAPTEFRADAVIELTDGAGKPVLAVVVEAQLSEDRDKWLTWPVYVVTTRARLGCPVELLVLCPDPAVAAWCAKPIPISLTGMTLKPHVLGPDRTPQVTDPGLARRAPEVAVLSAIAHGTGPEPDKVFEALLAALDVLDHDHANLYYDVVLAVLPAAARNYLEAFMTTTTHRYHSDFARRYYDQGEAEGEARGKALGEAEGEARGRAMGEARAVLAFLDARGVKVPAKARNRIIGCTDLDQLDIWARRAATASSVHDLFR